MGSKQTVIVIGSFVIGVLLCHSASRIGGDHAYGRLSRGGQVRPDLCVDFGPVDVVRFAEAFGAKGWRIETSDQIASTIKKALAMQGPVIIGVPVDYSDNHQFMDILHPSALN
jgi:thiamine pyrophosphate-dependent acetolactate synthase large subunit-like protein